METKTTKNKTGKARKNISNINSNISYSIACDNRRPLAINNWSVIPILSSMQKVMGDMLANADLSYYSERVNK